MTAEVRKYTQSLVPQAFSTCFEMGVAESNNVGESHVYSVTALRNSVRCYCLQAENTDLQVSLSIQAGSGDVACSLGPI